MHLFDEAIDLKRIREGDDFVVFSGTAHPAFTNMIGPFGGWSAAILAKAMMVSAGEDMELVSITTDFMAGVEEGPIEIETRCDRAGRSTEFWSARLTGNDGQVLGTRATGILSRRRDTISWTEGQCPKVPDPESCERFEVPMAWTKTLEIRNASHQAFKLNKPTEDMNSSAWVRIDPPRTLDAAALVALADTPTPRLFLALGRPDVISTVSMTVYIHASKEDFAKTCDDYLLVDTDGARGHRGFYDQHARMWSRDGRLLATTQQIVWYKAAAEPAVQTG